MSDVTEKLARTRLAIIDHISRRERRAKNSEARRNHEQQSQTGDEPLEDEDTTGGVAGWLSRLKRAASAWWRHHPAHLGLELATPALSAYAGKKPMQFLGIAAALGAVVVVARPWRLISATSLLVALLKSSQLSSMVMSAMSAADFEKDHDPRR